MELGQLLRCVACQKAPPKRTRRTFIVQAPQFRNGPLQFLARRLSLKLFVIVQWADDSCTAPVNPLPGTRYPVLATHYRHQ